MQSAGQDTPGVGQCQHKLGLRLSIKAEDGRHRDHLGWRGAGAGTGQLRGNLQPNDLYVSVLSTSTGKFLVRGKTEGKKKSPSCICGV